MLEIIVWMSVNVDLSLILKMIIYYCYVCEVSKMLNLCKEMQKERVYGFPALQNLTLKFVCNAMCVCVFDWDIMNYSHTNYIGTLTYIYL